MKEFKAPIKKHVDFYRTEGNYNWLNSNDRSAQYVIRFPHLNHEQIKELGLTSSFLVDIEKDYDYSPDSYTALECLNEILSIYESYWMHSGKEEVRKTIAYLQSIEEEQEKLECSTNWNMQKLKCVIGQRC